MTKLLGLSQHDERLVIDAQALAPCAAFSYAGGDNTFQPICQFSAERSAILG